MTREEQVCLVVRARRDDRERVDRLRLANMRTVGTIARSFARTCWHNFESFQAGTPGRRFAHYGQFRLVCKTIPRHNLESFPWVSGSVVYGGGSSGSGGVLCHSALGVSERGRGTDFADESERRH